ncbi:MAG: DNA polymerase III subunit gamma/tau [Rikenellaceae bacterium]|nr:DNA polymerase III subunit gamma/tau [Rikenellaceae bacterium]MCL2693279.1 DNA polymerase III subunit gamma/tau [Rikenellaceae bacterium]
MDNFVVSARKYRPATFVTVVGQGHITGTLRNAIGRGQLAHAYLFCGPRGVGKTTCARIFAKAINCSMLVESEACGECESCRSFGEGRSFTIHELDAASNNSVDDIRSLTEQVRIPPPFGRYSVYIIDEVHMLSASAFNAFLKTLEEPPAHAVFILATTEKHKILPTILSRCQIFDFNRIRVEDMVGYLRHVAGQEGVTADDESLHLIALKADGGMRDALSMFDKAVSFCGNTLTFKEVARTLNVLDYDTYFNLTALLLAGDYPVALTVFDEVLRKGFSPQSLAGGLNSHLRDLLMSKNPQTLSLLEVSGSLLERYKVQGAECPTEFLFGAIAALTALDGTLRTATSARLNVELGLMKLCGLSQKKNSDVELDIEIKVELPPLRRAESPPQLSQPVAPEVSEQQVITPHVASSSSSVPAEEPPQKRRVATQSIVAGNSLNEILGSSPKCAVYAVDEDEEQQPETTPVAVDPECESKIRAVRAEFLNEVYRERPRIAMALEEMEISGNRITLKVPTETLYEDIMRSRAELLAMLVDITGIDGRIDFEVSVAADDKARKPIKVEDKLKFLADKNPTLNVLRRELNLELE